MTRETEMRPPLRVWKLALLFLATGTLYLFAWFYRVAEDVKRMRDAPFTPWHWAAAPLLGPFIAIPVFYLASSLKAWQVEEDTDVGHLSEPVLVAMLVICAYLPFLMLIVNAEAYASIAVATALLLCLPCLVLQNQFNINVDGDQDSAEQARYSRHQWVSMVFGVFLAVPLYLYTFTQTWERRGSLELTEGEVITLGDSSFQIRIGSPDWTQINTGHLSEDSVLEFLGPDQWSWAIVYDSTGLDVDSVLSYRIGSSLEDYRGATCKQVKSLLPETLVVLATVECTGRNIVDGNFLLVARVLSDEDGAYEIVAGTSHSDQNQYENYASRVLTFVAGLELTQ